MRKLADAPDLIGTLRALLPDREAARLTNAAPELLRRFFEQSERAELYETALAIEGCADRSDIPPLIETLLHDRNPHRREAAARALGWIRLHPVDERAARALAHCLADPSQPQPAREEAAESLAYVGTRESVDTLIAAAKDPDVRIRFWVAFALGGRVRKDPRAIRALESLLTDNEEPPDGWWSVGREALAMLSDKQRLNAETAKVLANPEASEADRRWAEHYML